MEHSSNGDVIHLLAKTVAHIVVKTASFKRECHSKTTNKLTIDTLLSDDILHRIIDCLIRNKYGSYPLQIDGQHLELTTLGSTIATGLIATEWFSSGFVLNSVRKALQTPPRPTIKDQLESAIKDDLLGLLCGTEMEVDENIDARREKLLTALLESVLSNHEEAIIKLLVAIPDTSRKAGGRRRTRRVHQKKHRIPVQRRNTRRYRKSARK